MVGFLRASSVLKVAYLDLQATKLITERKLQLQPFHQRQRMHAVAKDLSLHTSPLRVTTTVESASFIAPLEKKQDHYSQASLLLLFPKPARPLAVQHEMAPVNFPLQCLVAIQFSPLFYYVFWR